MENKKYKTFCDLFIIFGLSLFLNIASFDNLIGMRHVMPEAHTNLNGFFFKWQWERERDQTLYYRDANPYHDPLVLEKDISRRSRSAPQKAKFTASSFELSWWDDSRKWRRCFLMHSATSSSLDAWIAIGINVNEELHVRLVLYSDPESRI